MVKQYFSFNFIYDTLANIPLDAKPDYPRPNASPFIRIESPPPIPIESAKRCTTMRQRLKYEIRAMQNPSVAYMAMLILALVFVNNMARNLVYSIHPGDAKPLFDVGHKYLVDITYLDQLSEVLFACTGYLSMGFLITTPFWTDLPFPVIIMVSRTVFFFVIMTCVRSVCFLTTVLPGTWFFVKLHYI